MSINPIVVRDCADQMWSDTWALDLDGETIAYVHSEDWAGILAGIFNPLNDSLDLLDALALVMRAGNALVADFERLRRSIESSETKEALADYAHQAWSEWMLYLFEKSQHNEDGTMTIPAWAVERWTRQSKMPYNKLPEEEKGSDRTEAHQILTIIRAAQ